MRKLLLTTIATILLITSTTGCTDFKAESDQNSVPTKYQYGTLVKIKDGLFRGFSCAVITVYSDSLFCRIMVAPDGTRLNDKWETNQNFKLDNVEILP